MAGCIGAAVDISQELLGGARRGNQRRRAGYPADLPAGQRKRLARRRDGQRPVPLAGQRRHRYVRTVEHQMLVHLIGDDVQVVLDRDIGDRLQLRRGQHRAGRDCVA